MASPVSGKAGSICGITFTFTNRCGDTVWPGLLSGSGTPPLETTGFALAPGQLRSLYAPQGWSGRFWGRSGCTFDASGKGSCATGDCGSGEVECRGAGASPPATLAEFTLDDDGGKDFYDDSVCHRVQGEVGSLNDARYLENILLLLTGRQLDTATEIAASRGDVRLAILLSQAGGSMSNRSDLAQTLDQYKMNGLDFDYIEEDWLKAAFLDLPIDWKRYLGLIMWYQLSPDTPLDIIIRSYDLLLGEGKVPYPVPVYIDEGPLDEAPQWSPGDHFDISFYLMLLHANKDEKFGLLKTMFSAFSSSFDPLDYHFIWHQRSILEVVGAFSSNDLHLLDLSFVYQLLCLGRCHWAIYVILHMPYLEDAPYIHEKLIREVLSQYCESWSRDDAQRQYIVELGIPEEWMHEALEVWRITSALENHKYEIADWDLGAGIYIDFYVLKNSMQERNAMDDSGSLEEMSESCRSFFGRLNESLLVWGSKLPVESRACYSKMAEELCALLVDTPSDTLDLPMGCLLTMLNAPVPDESRSSYLQDALSIFTEILCSDP
ncbi:Nuclear pore complex protein NUP96 [Zea mays]|uniref:Nuclear pore complex protein NUP96 n=1 Tax=Zea mays TaxID=4577 RepID=A0A317YI84_MAIZE|nr:Nuclear pore complex protein NUP96 [Zea mays]